MDINQIHPSQSFTTYDGIGPEPAVSGFPGVRDGVAGTEFVDGSFFPDSSPMEKKIDPANHYQNLAEVLPFAELKSIGDTLLQAIEDDEQSQKPFCDGVTELVRELGVVPGGSSPVGADVPFNETISVQSSALFNTLNQCGAVLREHLFKANDMCETQVIGQLTDAAQDSAMRMKYFLNDYLTTKCKEFRKEGIRTCIWAYLAGYAYKKVVTDPVLGRPTSFFIPIEDFIVHRTHSSHHAATRRTHKLRITERELNIRRMNGMYRDIPVQPAGEGTDESSDLQDLLDEIKGYEEVYQRGDKEYVLYEAHVELYIKDDAEAQNSSLPLPYIITLDKETGTVLSIYRNWRPNDETHKKIEYFVCYSFFPSLDGEGYGLTNFALRLARSSTLITRSMLTSSLYASFPGGMIQGGVQLENNNMRPAPGEWVRANTASPSLRDAVMQFPYNEPSPILHEMRNEMDEAITHPFSLVTDKIVDMAQRAPQGTTLFLLEQMQKVPSSLLSTMYESFAEELTLLCERISEWLPPDAVYPFSVPGGDHVIMAQDFKGMINVLPSCDPSLPNSAYRILQSELVCSTADKYPQLHDMREVLASYYKNLGIGEERVDKFLLPDPSKAPPVPALDPVTENANMLNGSPVNISPDQDHDAHEIVHSVLLTHADPNVAAAAHAHIKAHQASKFMVTMFSQLGMPIPQDPTQVPMDVQNAIAAQSAQMVQQQQQQDQAQQGPTPQQVQMMKIQSDQEIANMNAQIKLQELEFEREKARLQAMVEEKTIQEREQSNAVKIELEKMHFEHQRIIKESELHMKEVELGIKKSQDVRDHEKHVKELTQPQPTLTTKEKKNV